MYQNIIHLFFFLFLTNTSSFFVKNSVHTTKTILRLSGEDQQNQEGQQPIQKSKLHRFGLYPRLDPPNDKGQLTW